MTPIYADISAAPHLPPALRVQPEGNVMFQFMGLLSGRGDIQVIEENGELFVVSHPITTD